MEVILDTNFIISCIRKKIDFYEQLTDQGFKVVFPREVLQELKDVRRKNNTSHEDRIAIDLALQMIEKNKVKKMSLGQGKVDDWLIHQGNKGIYIATLDAAIKRQIPKKVIIFDAQKRVGPESG